MIIAKKKDGYRFVADNTGEVTPFDWYSSRISVGFKVQKMDNTNIAGADHNGIVNGSHSLIKDIDVKLNGRKVYDCNDANHSVNIKKHSGIQSFICRINCYKRILLFGYKKAC